MPGQSDADDELDGCGLDFTEDAASDEEVELLPLFPDAVPDPEKAAAWRELFEAGG